MFIRGIKVSRHFMASINCLRFHYSVRQLVQHVGTPQTTPSKDVFTNLGQSTTNSVRLYERRLQIELGARPANRFPSKDKFPSVAPT